MMDIVFCTDNNYVMPCGISMVSLFENNNGQDITVHIIGMNLDESGKDKLKGISDKYNSSIIFYNIDEEYIKKFKLMFDGPRHISIAAYIRLFIPEIVSDNINKVLYLDCDLIVVRDLSELWNTNIDNHSIAGVLDGMVFQRDLHDRLGYSKDYPYVNSGVLLINLEYWRQNRILEKLLEYAKNKFEDIFFMDQDVINGTLHESTLLVHMKYNSNSIFYEYGWNPHSYKDEAEEARTNPVIIHYSSADKPWQKGRFHPLIPIYLKYKELSPWKNEPLRWYNPSLKKKIKYYKRVLLYKLGLKKPRYISV